MKKNIFKHPLLIVGFLFLCISINAQENTFYDSHDEERIRPKKGYLKQNTPNPTRIQTKIGYQIPESAREASIVLSHINGDIIHDIPIKFIGGGEIELDTRYLPTGLYIYTLLVDGVRVDSKKMLIIR